ncbi:hypothetical protein E2562_030690 [Oryza meyeriana var. granulata]|uniref:Urease accessory protein UreH-like transmembrane domain-containing protein n=1 Tax=Oryza meyeriana var. granulata TaxID=110450 RepID=A0A6G1DP68_9ORYZ|nr:hypothetical protein E2562_030690 [Oryza meyeriana var. granulata]
MERLISKSVSASSLARPRIPLPGGSPFRRLSVAGGGVEEPWAGRLRAEQPTRRLEPIAAAAPLRHDGASAPPQTDAEREVAAAAAVGPPWKLLWSLLPKDRLHIEILQAWGTRVVGLTLLIIGGMGIREASEVHESSLALEGVDCNISSSEPLQTPVAPRKKKVGFATFATGVVHGLQPDALLMVLPALALPSRLAGSCSEALKEKVPRITEKLTWAASLVAICMGIALLVGQVFGFSLY